MLKYHNYNEVIDVINYYYLDILTNVPRKNSSQINITGENRIFIIEIVSAPKVLDEPKPSSLC